MSHHFLRASVEFFEEYCFVQPKLSQPFPKNSDWKEVNLNDSPDPISQVQKMNFKRLDEFTCMVQVVKDMFKILENE